MGALALGIQSDPHRDEMISFLSEDGAYWLNNDKWNLESSAFEDAGIETKGQNGILADFSGYQNEDIKNEMKFYILH